VGSSIRWDISTSGGNTFDYSGFTGSEGILINTGAIPATLIARKSENMALSNEAFTAGTMGLILSGVSLVNLTHESGSHDFSAFGRTDPFTLTNNAGASLNLTTDIGNGTVTNDGTLLFVAAGETYHLTGLSGDGVLEIPVAASLVLEASTVEVAAAAGFGLTGGTSISLGADATLTNQTGSSIVGGMGGGGDVGGHGGIGVSFGANGTLINESGASIGGGSGGVGSLGGGRGGTAVLFNSTGTLTNQNASITGGTNQAGASAGNSGMGVSFLGDGTVTNQDGASINASNGPNSFGGNGSIGVSFSANGTLTNLNATITGGNGNNGGNGGNGVFVNGVGTLTNGNGTITGGSGAQSIFGGGNGADGIAFNSVGTLTNENGASIVAGGGGESSDNNGGNGGNGVSFNNGGTLTNQTGASIVAGAGGNNPGEGGSSFGGNGGNGVFFQGGGAVVNQTGASIIAGAGGNSTSGTAGSNGYGVFIQGGRGDLTNSGTIQGSVIMENHANTVTLVSGGVIDGDLYAGPSQSTTLILDGPGNQTYSAAVTGTSTFFGSFVKQGAGTWTLDRPLNTTLTTNSGTTISAGRLNIATVLYSNMTVTAGATLGGNGIVTGNVNVLGNQSPGTSPGIQTVDGDLAYSGSLSTIEWELEANAIGTRGTAYDGINVASNVDFEGLTTLQLDFAINVDWTNSFWDTDKLGTSGWLVYDISGSITSFANLGLSAPSTWLDKNGVLLSAERSAASFALYQNGSDIYLNYTVVPEHGASALFLLALVAAIAIHRRRRA